MASFYSELMAAPSTPQVLDTQVRANAGVGHARMRYTRAAITLDAVVAIGEVVRMKTFSSSDRLNWGYFHCSDAGTGGLIDVGLYKAGTNHDGAVIDADLFMSAYDVKAAAREQIEILPNSGSGTLGGIDSGKTLWEMATLGAASYTSDPMEQWDIAIVPTEATTNTAWEVMMEFYYTSGD